jgi:outer membrane lipoprotein-sorting protein
MVVPGRKCFSLSVVLITLMAWSETIASGQAPSKIPAEPRLTLSQVVEKLVQKNAERAKALEGYRAKRVYELEYNGFPKTLRAEMVVEMTYHAPAQKEFKIVSESGSKWIVKRVLKRLLDEESEAQQASNRLNVELNSRNYEFTSLEYQSSATDCTYVLAIQPKAPNKYVYRGRIWVDEKDFAVCRIEAEPAKNPSMWITKTEIHHRYHKFEDFWLPVENQSISNLRLGGRATLTITYQNYEINADHAPKGSETAASQ